MEKNNLNKINSTGLILITVLFITGLPVSMASSPPPIPNTFSGTAKFAYSGGQCDVPPGTLIEALIENVTKGSTTVIEAGKYRIDVSGTNDDADKNISFIVNNLIANQQAVFIDSSPPPMTLNLIVNITDTAPASVTSLNNITYASTYINWTWTDPEDIYFSHVIVYFDGMIRSNVSKGVQYYNATGLTPGTTHTISTRTVGISGSINQAWVNNTATTNLSGQKRGDLNRNYRLDTGDATMMLRTIVELPIPSEYLPVLPAGDMNCNNRIDTGDATLVLRDIVSLPIPRCWV